MKFNCVLNNQYCRLIAGNLSITFFVIGIPLAIILMAIESWTPILASLIILAILHFGFIGLQISNVDSGKMAGGWVCNLANA